MAPSTPDRRTVRGLYQTPGPACAAGARRGHRDVTFPERAPGLLFFALSSYEGGPMAGGKSSGGSEKSGNKGSGGKKK